MNCCPSGFSVHGIFQARIWSQLPFPSPRGLPDLGMETLHWQEDSLALVPPGKPQRKKDLLLKSKHLQIVSNGKEADYELGAFRSCPWQIPAVLSVKSLQSCLSLSDGQRSLSMGFSRQEYWSGLPFPSSGDLPDPGIEPASLMSPALAGGFFTTSTA